MPYWGAHPVLFQPQIPSTSIYPNMLLAIISIIIFSFYLIACQEVSGSSMHLGFRDHSLTSCNLKYYHSSLESLHTQNVAMFLSELCVFAPLALGLFDSRTDMLEQAFTKNGAYILLHGFVGLTSSGILKRESAAQMVNPICSQLC